MNFIGVPCSRLVSMRKLRTEPREPSKAHPLLHTNTAWAWHPALSNRDPAIIVAERLTRKSRLGRIPFDVGLKLGDMFRSAENFAD
jgi:hypothetical protein